MSNKKTKAKINILILTGSVGVGKSSTAYAIYKILSKKSIPNAVIDLDYLGHAYPKPKNDPFHTKLRYKNLFSVWNNYKDIGITNLIIPYVVESKKELTNIKSAIPGADILVVYLKADLKTINMRLKNNYSGKSLKRHQNHAIVLTKQLETNKIENFAVNTKNKSVGKIAEEIITKTGWL